MSGELSSTDEAVMMRVFSSPQMMAAFSRFLSASAGPVIQADGIDLPNVEQSGQTSSNQGVLHQSLYHESSGNLATGSQTRQTPNNEGVSHPVLYQQPSGNMDIRPLAAQIHSLQPSMDLYSHLFSIGFKPPAISRMFDLNCRSLRYHLKKQTPNVIRVAIDDSELDARVADIIDKFPAIGSKLLKGFYTNAHGHGVSRARIRESLNRVRISRNHAPRMSAIKRRKYHVKAPLSMVHIDGHHKLITYGFVIHAGIDGYSRTIVFMALSNNNRADTVRNHFMKGVLQFGMPARIRVDLGGENTSIADFMLAGREGHVEMPVVTGRSVHNQRIERLWRDVFEYSLQPFYSTFKEMERIGILNPSNDVDIFCLHTVASQLLSTIVAEFQKGWNYHPLSTEHNLSPIQLFWQGLLKLKAQGGNHVEFSQDPTNTLLAENEARLIQEFTLASRRHNAVQVRPFMSPLVEREDAILRQSFRPNDVTLENLIDNYVIVKGWVQECIHRDSHT